MTKANMNLRKRAKSARVPLWAIGDVLGFSEATMTRRLRHELSAEEQEKVFTIIEQLKMEREGC